MEKKRISRAQNRKEIPSPGSNDKKRWQEPKVLFVEPKLTKHGELKELTGFFGGFSPGPF